MASCPPLLHLALSLFMFLLRYQVKTPRGTDHRGLVLGWKALRLFQGALQVRRQEKIFEVDTERKQSLWLGDGCR